MLTYLRKSLCLLGLSLVACCVLYPALLWVTGQAAFRFQAEGSIVSGPDGKPVGSLLIAQPFTKDEYFQPRPSAASYDAGASASSALAVSNYALRARIAGALGPVVCYKAGPKAGQLVGPDVESWFQQDRFAGQGGIVAQWADAHNALAKAWVAADPTHAKYVDDWAKGHPAVVAQFVRDHPAPSPPQAPDLAVVFFETFSKEHPGAFPAAANAPAAASQAAASTTAPAATIAPAKEGPDIQATFFDMWRQEHADVELQDVPADMVTTSASGLDPHITLANALFQLDRVAAKWAATTHRPVADVRSQIEHILRSQAFAPFHGLVGEPVVNVLQVNLELRRRYAEIR